MPLKQPRSRSTRSTGSFKWKDLQQKVLGSFEGEARSFPGLAELSARGDAGNRRHECGVFTFWMTHRHNVLSKKPLTRALQTAD